MSLRGDLRDRLESVQDNLKILIRQVQDSKATPTSATPTAEGDYRAGLQGSTQLVSSSCTKMAVLFSKPPVPPLTDCGVVCRQLEQATLRLVSTLYRIDPAAHGRTLHNEARWSVLEVLTSVQKLVEVFIKKGCTSGQVRLSGAGTVWGSCEKVGKLSRDNRQAASKVCLSQLRLLQDAWQELRQLQSRNGEGTEDDLEGFELDEDLDEVGGASAKLEGVSLEEAFCWSEEDMALVNPCVSIVQSVADFTKTTCHQLVTGGGVVAGGGVSSTAELDRVVEEVCALSPLVDDLVSELPAPIYGAQLVEMGTAVGKQFLQFIKAVDSSSFADHAPSNKPSPHATPTLYKDITQSNLAILRDCK